jgi:hypothetical protein
VINENNPASADDEAEETVSVKKTKGPSKEELVQDKMIRDLQALYRCEDRKCSFDFCWPAGEDATHIHLTHLHLRTWSAAMVSSAFSYIIFNQHAIRKRKKLALA